MTRAKVIIPFRLRDSGDPRRGANLEIVMTWWWINGFDPVIQDDGLSGDEQFNRHRAYNRAVARFPNSDVFIFAEADMIIHPSQVIEAANRAVETPGLVVPFSQYRYLSDDETARVRDNFHVLKRSMLAEWLAMTPDNPASIFAIKPESTMDDNRSIGAINVISAQTLEMTGGFTEATSGNWYDDRIIEEGFAFLTGPTRFIPGPAVHLYHLPGWKGDHLTTADRRATERNKNLLNFMRWDIKKNNRQAVKELMEVRHEEKIKTGDAR